MPWHKQNMIVLYTILSKVTTFNLKCIPLTSHRKKSECFSSDALFTNSLNGSVLWIIMRGSWGNCCTSVYVFVSESCYHYCFLATYVWCDARLYIHIRFLIFVYICHYIFKYLYVWYMCWFRVLCVIAYLWLHTGHHMHCNYTHCNH